MTRKIRIVEVGPRDGLQNQPQTLPVAARIALIEDLADAGLTDIECGSFVSPRWVPQMADTDQVLRGLRPLPGVRRSVLVPNRQGWEAAKVAGVEEVAVFVSASEGFSHRNTNCSVAEALDRSADIARLAIAAGVSVRGYISCVAACPIDGPVAPAQVATVARALIAMGCRELSLGDTTGVATPLQIERMLDAVLPHVPVMRLALHCHDTYGQALANIYAGLGKGIAVFDTSIAGLGGCPYAPRAAGNAATEDVVYMMHGMGLNTGTDPVALNRTAQWVSGLLGVPIGSHVGKVVQTSQTPRAC